MLSGIVRSLPADWSFAQLKLVTFRQANWFKLHARWAEMTGRRVGAAVSDSLLKPHPLCPTEAFSNAAYVARGSAIEFLQSVWPVVAESSAHGDGGFAANVSQACWTAKCSTLRGRGTAGMTKAKPDFVADHCLLHYGSYGPALSADEVPPGASVNEAARLVRLHPQRPSLQTFLIVPPLVVDRGLADSSNSSTLQRGYQCGKGGMLSSQAREQLKRCQRDLVQTWWQSAELPAN
jgi:hypothetical protein